MSQTYRELIQRAEVAIYAVDLRDYNHPLPKRFTSCDGYMDLEGYNHPLPKGMKVILDKSENM